MEPTITEQNKEDIVINTENIEHINNKIVNNDNDHDNQLMIDFIINQKDAFFKSQQKGEEDISDSEKRSIVERLLDTNKSSFLHLYGKYLDANTLNRLSELFVKDNNEDVDVQIKDLQQRLKRKQTMVKNRRYKAVQKMLSEGNYFSNCEMQSRQPYLFEQMVGQYMSNAEQKELQESSYRLNHENANFSSFLMEQIRTIHLKCKYMVDENIEQQEEEEEDEEGEEEEAEKEVDEEEEGENVERRENGKEISPEDKEMLQMEFKKIMTENFLMGKDGDFFDYSQVDNNEDLDMNEEFERDQQDRYFDED